MNPVQEIAHKLLDFWQVLSMNYYLWYRTLKLEKIGSAFQTKLSNDLKEIHSSRKFFVSADKSRNIYKLEPDEYKKLLRKNITKEYKKIIDREGAH